jgi:hypothetical protein
MTSLEKVDQLESDLLATTEELRRLQNLIGRPPEGSHPDEMQPRDSTWHMERQNHLRSAETLRNYAENVTRILEQVLIDFRSFDKSGVCDKLRSVNAAEQILEARKPRPI